MAPATPANPSLLYGLNSRNLGVPPAFQAAMRLLVIPLVGLALATPAFADQLVATRPGLGCRSLRALAVLTRPDGSSRIGTPQEKPGDAELKASGGCLDIPEGARAVIQKYWHHTALVSFDPGDGSGPRDLTVPTIDFNLVFTYPGEGDPSIRQPGSWHQDGDTYVWTPG